METRKRALGGSLMCACGGAAAQNASEFQTWKSRPQLIHMQYAMLNEASGASNDPRLAKWQSIVVRPPFPDLASMRQGAHRNQNTGLSLCPAADHSAAHEQRCS